MENGKRAQYANICAFREVILAENAPVFALFLIVSTLYPRRRICLDRCLDQIPSIAIPGVGYCL